MRLMYLLGTAGVTALLAGPVAAEPVALTDASLSHVVGGSIVDGDDNRMAELARLNEPRGGVVSASDGDISIDETSTVSLTGNAQRDATGLEIFNASSSNIGSGLNINVESPANQGDLSTISSRDTSQTLDQANVIGLSSASMARADQLRVNDTVTTSGVATSDQSTSDGSVSTGSAVVELLGIIEVSVPVGSGFVVAGDADLEVQSFDVSVGDAFSLAGPSIDVALEGGGCYVSQGECSANRTNAITSAPFATAAAVPSASGSSLSGEVISLGDGDVEIVRASEVTLADDAQRDATGLKIVNAASSLVGSGVNIAVNRCCKVNFNGGARNIVQRNVVYGQY